MSKRLKTIPKFPSEAAERTFWEKNDSSKYLNARDVPYQSLIKVWLQEKVERRRSQGRIPGPRREAQRSSRNPLVGHPANRV
jgi:hypothetical protein